MEDDIQNYLPTVKFRGTLCTISLPRSLPLNAEGNHRFEK